MLRNSSVAAALEFDAESMDTPLLAACGSAEVAREMRRVALRYGVPIVEDPGLAVKLANGKVSETINRDLFQEVADLFISLSNPSKSVLKKCDPKV